MKRVRMMSAGSLRLPLEDIIEIARTEYQIDVSIEYGPSGVLRERIESGEDIELFASADMGHPLALWKNGFAFSPLAFAGNALCLMIAPDIDIPNGLETNLKLTVDWLEQTSVRLATSTPRLDPSGDYAWSCFALAEKCIPGSGERLSAKAIQAVGGRDPKWCHAVDGKSPVARLFLEKRADVFLGYMTSARIVEAQAPGVCIQSLPQELRVETTCGLAVLKNASFEALQLACLIASVQGESCLKKYGFRTFTF